MSMENKCLVMALFLPQFHQIPQNDEWWGEGFTEWSVVKEATKINKFSIQPKIPVEGYYDLAKVNTLKNQADLATKHGIDGFIFYNYYSNGEKLLDLPIKNLLNNKDINIEYIISWANHDWKRTWYNWNQEMLRKQLYGNEKQITEHFEYLLTYFKDVRYTKIDNKPVFCVYRYKDIPNFNQYYKIWNSLAKANGFNGIYFLQTLDNTCQEIDHNFFDAGFEFEPNYTLKVNNLYFQRTINKICRVFKKYFKLKRVNFVYDYKFITKAMSERKDIDSNRYLGVFPDWDNTPRHKYNGTVFRNSSAHYFEEQFRSQYKKALQNNNRILVINSWNEWSEGAYLEPDTFNNYDRLEAIYNGRMKVINELSKV